LAFYEAETDGQKLPQGCWQANYWHDI